MPSRFLQHLLLTTLTLALGLSGVGPAAAQTTRNVTNCSDTPGTGLTLRQAIEAASAGDTIQFPATSCVIVLVGAPDDENNLTGDLDILKSLTFEGAGERTTIIDGGTLDRVFDIAPGTTVVMRKVTIRNGNATQSLSSTDGGAIFNGGDLTLDTVIVTGSTGRDGGGVFVATGATLTVTNSTISSNTAAAAGGGIFNNGSATLTNSTISGNRAANDGGGIQHGGTALALPNVTITNNTANSDNTGGSTGGGINSFGASPTLLNTIVAGNAVGTGGANPDCQATPPLTSVATNVFGSLADCGGSGSVGDIQSVSPGLGPLEDNGGPTPTHALLPGSPAIDNGSNTGCPTTDQRGFARPAAGVPGGPAICDIGAFELTSVQAQAILNLALNQTAFTAGQTLRASITVENPGGALLVDVVFGILAPASAGAGLGCPAVPPLAFVTQSNAITVVCSNASPATFPLLLEDATVQANLARFTVNNFFSVTFPAITPRGSYLLFIALLRPNSLTAGFNQNRDVLVATSVSFVIQ